MSATNATKTVGIIGSGVTGLAAASVLDKQGIKVILLEKEQHIGGHCYTQLFTDPNTNKPVEVDMGFMVFSPETYINFIEWLEEYQVEFEDTNMSFSASLPNGFEWNSNNPFADLSIFLQWETIQLFWDLCRYEKILHDEMKSLDPNKNKQTVADLQAKYSLSDAFMKYFLLPQCGSIWSMPADQFKNIPSDFVIQFTFKHRLSCLWGRPMWKTITGRSQVYVQKILDAHFRNERSPNMYKTQCDVKRLIFDYNGTKQIKIEYNGDTKADVVVDHVLFCCHAKHALQILNNSNTGPTRDEADILRSFDFGENTVILHGNKDIAMPSSSKMWAAWNYHTSHNEMVNVTYWLNLLQNLSPQLGNVFATLNPSPQQREILERDAYHIWHTQHPKYDRISWNVIKCKLLDKIQCVEGRNVSFAGAWQSFGFHRDGFLSGTKEAWRIVGKEYKPKSINIEKGSSYWFSFCCCFLHYVILWISSFFHVKL
eukprot:127047_1